MRAIRIEVWAAMDKRHTESVYLFYGDACPIWDDQRQQYVEGGDGQQIIGWVEAKSVDLKPGECRRMVLIGVLEDAT